MPSDQSDSEKTNGIIIRPSTGLVSIRDGASSAMTEIISRSLVHIQTSQSLAVPERRAGEEQEFEIAPGVKIVMCWIPAGKFLMGSPEGELGRRGNETLHRVTISQGFWLGKYQVTQTQWHSVMESNPSHFKGANLPVDYVSWKDISEPGGFMEKVNRFAARGTIFSLPTEAQWEYACRAGTVTALNSGKNLTTDDGPCPNLDELAWYSENSGGEMHQVGQKKANAWGLHDMHGNVSEWCADWLEDDTDEPQVDPRGVRSEGSVNTASIPLPEGESFVLPSFYVPPGCACRGGNSFYSDADDCRAARRANDIPTQGRCGIGFRIARSSVPMNDRLNIAGNGIHKHGI